MRPSISRFWLFAISLAIALYLAHPAHAANLNLVPCSESAAFQQRQNSAPEGYYYTKPFEVYSSELLCGEDGLPHLPLDRLDRAVDVAIPIALFLYVAGFIGWSGRAYLQAASKSENPAEKEIFIDLPLALQSFIQGLLWPLLALQQLLSGKLTVKESEITVSPR
ncbi:Photosystem I reaction center subunit III [Altericista sp. CCNU0014]|uniref:Photosystem I reaction center subunit III n=1 Tax=Altericista sp. CCNU0014 TaxID=3082949 RepID=UPI00384C416D